MQDDGLKITKEKPANIPQRLGYVLFNLVEGVFWLITGIVGLLAAIVSGLASFISGDH